jgi:ribonuclease Z
MLQVIVLGSAASMPTKDRGLPAFAILNEGDLFLFDCGEGTQRQLIQFGLNYSKLKAVFITHLHLDHILGLFGLCQTLRLSGFTKKIDVFAPKALGSLFKIFGVEEIVNFYPLSNKNNPKKPIFSTKSIEVFCKKVPSCPIETYCFLLKEKNKICFYEQKAKAAGLKGHLFSEIQKKGKLKINNKTIYLKDISYIKKGKSVGYCTDIYLSKKVELSILGFFKEADLLILDSTFSHDLENLAKERFHSTAYLAAKFAAKAKVKSLLLTHISARYSKDPSILLKEAKNQFSFSELAYDGLTINL